MKSAWLAIFSLAIGLAAAPTAHAQAQQTTVQDIIKRYPGQSLAAAAILGFLLARGLRSGD